MFYIVVGTAEVDAAAAADHGDAFLFGPAWLCLLAWLLTLNGWLMMQMIKKVFVTIDI